MGTGDGRNGVVFPSERQRVEESPSSRQRASVPSSQFPVPASDLAAPFRVQCRMRFPAHLRRSAFDVAIQQLRDGRPGENGYGRRLALLLTIPTFDDPVARDIRRSTTGEVYVVRTVWHRALDLATTSLSREITIGTGARALTAGAELTSFHAPSLQSARVDVDPLEISALLDRVESATVTCCPHQPEAPLDATVYELTFGEELNETRYRWFGTAPDGWEALGSFVSRVLRLVDERANIAAP